jgi:hypothetical protein
LRAAAGCTEAPWSCLCELACKADGWCRGSTAASMWLLQQHPAAQ